MLQINNQTPFNAELHPYEDLHGRDYAIIIIKGTFNPCGDHLGMTLCDEQAPIQHADEYYGEPGQSSIKYPTDLALVKKSTDLILLGHGYAPGGRATNQFDVSLSAGNFQHTVRVFGNRFWQKEGLTWQPSRPESLQKMPLTYENAFGGSDPHADPQGSEAFEYDPSNPIGKGFIPKKANPIEGLALPNLENPNDLIVDEDSQPKPFGFGAIARDWQPRLTWAGSYDEAWQSQRMPLLPLDFDARFFNAAHPNLCISPELVGDEVMTIKNATESGLLSFQLPNQQLIATASMRGQQADFIAKLDTVVIEPDENRVMLTWRAAIPIKRKFLYLDSVTIKRRH